MRKLYENFHIFYFQKRIVSAETILGNTVFYNLTHICSVVFAFCWITSHSVISYTLLKLDYLLSFPDFATLVRFSCVSRYLNYFFLNLQGMGYI